MTRLVDLENCLKRARRQDLRRKRNRSSASIDFVIVHQQWRDIKNKAKLDSLWLAASVLSLFRRFSPI